MKSKLKMVLKFFFPPFSCWWSFDYAERTYLYLFPELFFGNIPFGTSVDVAFIVPVQSNY